MTNSHGAETKSIISCFDFSKNSSTLGIELSISKISSPIRSSSRFASATWNSNYNKNSRKFFVLKNQIIYFKTDIIYQIFENIQIF
jgi:hypothetical protein